MTAGVGNGNKDFIACFLFTLKWNEMGCWRERPRSPQARGGGMVAASAGRQITFSLTSPQFPHPAYRPIVPPQCDGDISCNCKNVAILILYCLSRWRPYEWMK